MDRKIITAAVLMLTLTANNAVSQEKKEESIRNHSLYKSLMDVEAYTYAEEPFKELFYNDPSYSKQMYIDGVKIYKGLYAKATTPEMANGYTDTIEKMMTRLDLDLVYLRRHSIWFDFRVLGLTFLRVFSGKIF